MRHELLSRSSHRCMLRNDSTYLPISSWRFPVAICSLLFLTFVLAGSGGAQTPPNYVYSTGSPTFATSEPVENGFLDLSNGNLHVEIPLGSFPQRGHQAFSA